ncbi:hypothetical protein ACL7TT_13475 [Microbulbifer sp. 2304DJ12-6]|uniref:hypothetical protein n=1 Tax=Microbulbifer sp. 2304DJ12-6 TaxID=3233340 RepID=UPI0039AFF98F
MARAAKPPHRALISSARSVDSVSVDVQNIQHRHHGQAGGNNRVQKYRSNMPVQGHSE